jgi:uncharacterized iron-regulated membrane protein
MNTATPPLPAAPPAGSSLYRRVWRWHFYAGLVCLPFLVLLAITGALYLFKDPIEALLYQSLQTTRSPAGPVRPAEALVARALETVPGEAVRFTAPARQGRSAEVGIRTDGGGVVAVFLDPADGRVLGQLRDEDRLMQTVKGLHSLVLIGPLANAWVEVVAGWAIVLVVTGGVLWWPRGRPDGPWRVRGRPTQRLWWRDLHALAGFVSGAVVLFLAVTGMPWSAVWGEALGRLSTAHGLGMPRHVWGPPPLSSEPLTVLPALPWGTERLPLPQSLDGPQPGRPGASATAPPQAPPITAPDIGLDRALQRLDALGLPSGTPVRLPSGPRGVYSAVSFPDDVRGERVVHLDRYTGAVLADVGYAQYGPIARATQWGVALHTGRQLGLANLLLMLLGCVALVLLATSAVVMWWKRRPQGRLAAPPLRPDDRAARSALGIAVLLGVLYPLLGASMLVALLVDHCIPERWIQRFGL